eukprot:3341589-Rhodomonas_salina.1
MPYTPYHKPDTSSPIMISQPHRLRPLPEALGLRDTRYWPRVWCYGMYCTEIAYGTMGGAVP